MTKAERNAVLDEVIATLRQQMEDMPAYHEEEFQTIRESIRRVEEMKQ